MTDDVEPRSLKVLVVEDEWLLRETVVEDLKDAGYAVVEAETGDRAVALLQAREPVDVLFTDIRLPGSFDGWDVAERFREANPSLPVIYATGYAPGEHRLVPGSIFISKPYRCSMILKAIEDLTSSGRRGKVN